MAKDKPEKAKKDKTEKAKKKDKPDKAVSKPKAAKKVTNADDFEPVNCKDFLNCRLGEFKNLSKFFRKRFFFFVPIFIYNVLILAFYYQRKKHLS